MLALVKKLLKLSLVVYLAVCAALFFAQESLLFKPDHQVADKNTIFPEAIEYRIPVNDTLSLQAWFRPPSHKDAITVVMLHGNAGNLSTRKRHIDNFHDTERGFLIFSWRGYGDNPGKPSEAGLYADAQAVLNWLNQQGIPDSYIVLYGESLGGGVAI